MMNIVWLRRDLRLEDNAAIFAALRQKEPIQFIFIFDKNILDRLSDPHDARVSFIYYTLKTLKRQLLALGSDLWLFYGKPLEVWAQIVKDYKINTVFANRDYESYAIDRDAGVANFLRKHKIDFQTSKDHVIFEKDEILKSDGDPYVVFTPYKKRWLERLYSRKKDGSYYYLQAYTTKGLETSLNQTQANKQDIRLEDMGFQTSDMPLPIKTVDPHIVAYYGAQRDYPAMEGTSRLGLHFRFGTISIRQKARKALALSEVYLSELIWRDFYSQILAHFPHVEQRAFREKYDHIEWRNNEAEFETWCQGKTGYPMVDAGMRELNATGFMYNRVRMVTASFLTKHLLIDWRWGEAYFAEKLLDYDLASNNGGWQWAAGCGTDAAPYFRIFNPESQQKKFDKDHKYIRQWIGEWGTEDYPEPIVDHKEARERCLRVYKEALDRS